MWLIVVTAGHRELRPIEGSALRLHDIDDASETKHSRIDFGREPHVRKHQGSQVLAGHVHGSTQILDALGAVRRGQRRNRGLSVRTNDGTTAGEAAPDELA